MTYLELVNAVLRRLRESAVASVSQTTYSAMIGDLVNDAKRVVEDAWDWTALRDTLEVSATDGDYSYSLTGSGDRAKMLDVVNSTSKGRLRQSSLQRFNNSFLLGSPASGSPSEFIVRGIDASGDIIVELYPIPDGAYTIKFDMVVKQADLSDGADRLLVPSQPVMQLALALATREKGETGGTSAQEQFSIANTMLADAIAMDAGNVGHELIWTAP